MRTSSGPWQTVGTGLFLTRCATLFNYKCPPSETYRCKILPVALVCFITRHEQTNLKALRLQLGILFHRDTEKMKVASSWLLSGNAEPLVSGKVPARDKHIAKDCPVGGQVQWSLPRSTSWTDELYESVDQRPWQKNSGSEYSPYNWYPQLARDVRSVVNSKAIDIGFPCLSFILA